MSDYTDIDSVRAVLPSGVSLDDASTDKPTAATVNLWITEVSNQVNVAYAQGGSVTPLTDPDTIGMLKLMCSRELAYQVMATRNMHDDTKTPAYLKDWHTEFIKLLEKASEGAASAVATAGGTASSYTMNSPDHPDSSVNPVVERGMQF